MDTQVLQSILSIEILLFQQGKYLHFRYTVDYGMTNAILTTMW